MALNKDLELFFYVEESELHGKGLFAKISIEEGVYLGTYDGPDAKKNDMHVLWVEEVQGKWVGRDGKNMLRYINHSKNPLAEFDGFDLYATSFIQMGTEITIDYGEEP